MQNLVSVSHTVCAHVEGPRKFLARWYHRCKKTFFLRFLFRARFYVFKFFFILPTFFIFKNVHWKYHLKSHSKQQKQTGSVWLFFFVPMLEFPYGPIYWQALLFTYRIGLHQVTSLGVVFVYVGKLVGWKKINVFYSTFANVFLNFCHVFYVFNVFIFFLERFFTSMAGTSSP